MKCNEILILKGLLIIIDIIIKSLSHLFRVVLVSFIFSTHYLERWATFIIWNDYLIHHLVHDLVYFLVSQLFITKMILGLTRPRAYLIHSPVWKWDSYILIHGFIPRKFYGSSLITLTTIDDSQNPLPSFSVLILRYVYLLKYFRQASGSTSYLWHGCCWVYFFLKIRIGYVLKMWVRT